MLGFRLLTHSCVLLWPNRGLMDRDDFKNLGLTNLKGDNNTGSDPSHPTPSSQPSSPTTSTGVGKKVV